MAWRAVSGSKMDHRDFWQAATDGCLIAVYQWHWICHWGPLGSDRKQTTAVDQPTQACDSRLCRRDAFGWCRIQSLRIPSGKGVPVTAFRDVPATPSHERAHERSKVLASSRNNSLACATSLPGEDTSQKGTDNATNQRAQLTHCMLCSVNEGLEQSGSRQAA